MNIAMWLLAGGILGWFSYQFLDFNEGRSTMASVVIGAAGGLVGGKVIAPMFIAAAPIPADFSSSALFFAVAIAAMFLAVGSFIDRRWDI